MNRSQPPFLSVFSNDDTLATPVPLVARRCRVQGGQGWRSEVPTSGFDVRLEGAGMVLPAGWYLIEGVLESETNLTPSLVVTYADGTGVESMPLPGPDPRQRVRLLLMFRSPVAGLFFRPGDVAASFVLHGLCLRRVGRGRALMEMLNSKRGQLSARVLDGAGFLAAAPWGLRHATERLFGGYKRRLVPQRHAPEGYASWVAEYDTFDADGLDGLSLRCDALGTDGPLISIIVPVYQTPERWLRHCIESVLAQAYGRWELCISDDASPDDRVRQLVRSYAEAEPRIRYVFRETNGHISASSNSALALATGDYVALLDHDDELRPHALLEVAEAIVRNPSVGIIYSDEDKIDAEGRRFHPNFKPDWNPDLLRSQNYVCHLTTIRTDLVHEVGGFREGFEGSQDHDLILRCAERLSAAQIHHVPKVLYHWRAIEGSTALARGAKDYAADAGMRAVQDHLDRIGAHAGVALLPHGHYRVHWSIPEPAPKVSLVIPTRDKVDLLRMCVESILSKTTYPNFEIVVVDNQSSEPDALQYLSQLQAVPSVRVLSYDEPFNYSAINNWAVSQCDGVVVGLVNNDIEVISPDWLGEMVGHALRPDVGAVGAMLYYPDDTIQHGGVILGIGGVANHAWLRMPRGHAGHGARALVAQNMSAVTGACLLVERGVYEAVGGLDERLAVAFNDIDFCLRLGEAGYWNTWTPFAELYHHESASRGLDESEEKRARFAREVEFMQARWGGLLGSDPAYNPNLTLEHAQHSHALAWPPRT